MNYEQYLSLIQRLEIYAEKSPKGYRNRVFALAALGYGYFIGLILLFLSVPAIAILVLILAPDAVLRASLQLIKLWWLFLPGLAIFFGFLGGAIKALTANVPEPAGLELDKDAAPELREFVSRTCTGLKAKNPSKILITDEFNAAVITMPRFGLFGRKVYLSLGLPLMRSLTPEQFEAVLMHEIGHISGRHGGFAKWAYQLRDTWGRFIEAQELENHKFSALYEKFVNWYFPYFTAYSFVLMREHEKEADAYVVKSIGSKALGESLITLDTAGAAINATFWNDVSADNRAGKELSANMFTQMMDFLGNRDVGKDDEVLRKALEVPTDYNDSHPSLADRLRKIGYWDGQGMPPMPEKPAQNAMEFFLKGETAAFTKQFNTEWDENLAERWKSASEYNQKSADRLAELEEKMVSGEITADEMYERVALLSEQGSEQAGIIAGLKEIIDRFPEHASSHLSLGSLLLDMDDEAGMNALKKAEEIDPLYKLGASETAFNYLRRKGRYEEAKTYAAIVEEQYDVIRNAEAQRTNIYPTDEFEASGKTPEDIEMIWKKLEFFKEVQALYLVKKVLKIYPDPPVYVLFMVLNDPRSRGEDVTLNSQEMQEIAMDRLSQTDLSFIIPLSLNSGTMFENVSKVGGALIFERK